MIGAGVTGIAGAAYGVATGRGSAYAAAVRDTWRLAEASPPSGAALALVRIATLAPNSHNTQPWRFDVTPEAIRLRPDPTRRCPAVDPDDHHLFVSLGCAAETIVQAAPLYGVTAAAAFDPADGGSVLVRLMPSPPRPLAPLAAAIPLRQSTRADYDGRQVPTADLDTLAAAGREQGVDALLITERPAMDRVLDAVVEGARRQAGDAAFVAELRHWLRFSNRRAVATGDGLFSACNGAPVLPDSLGQVLFSLFYSADSEAKKYVGQVRSSAGLAVISSAADDAAHWVAAGRAFQRFALQATALGLKVSLLNPPVEVAALRPDFATALGLGGRRPDMVVRFGYGPAMPRSLRRDVAAVLG